MFILGYSGNVTRNTTIGTLANWGPEYRVKVEVIVHSAHSGWSNILHFTSTGSNCCNIGDRVPAIFYHSEGILSISSAVNEDGDYGLRTNIDLKKWYHIEIVQKTENGKVREYHNYWNQILTMNINI